MGETCIPFLTSSRSNNLPLDVSPLGLSMSLQLLHGDMEQIRKDYMRLFTRNISITKTLGFSDIIMPGERLTSLWQQVSV